ncbi:hypothetical protein ASPSYDRAFT_185663 [Aspergillus sydowii CBS 593.65]|uniref:Transcriptional repressor Tup1 N-terminal domain-containing protein n=1 Tax=Aspergillus sydowii CBS 593.65 TaxID=1036612 RepID=A0A1L9T5M1_9EURO|nr:uncharacterized protein ASPSYDRAFT_185663 [Aspergillus sydowii CBS 593.65]OJJ54750.1 hypothetical protein ASPSYDRAFT_185663 [Aspergillus sydowii CBS 593.65]
MDNTHHGTVPASSSRSAVLLDQIRQEFQNQTRASAEVEYKLTGQLHEMDMMRQMISELEAMQLKMKEKYEPTFLALRHQLESCGVPVSSLGAVASVPHQAAPSSSQGLWGGYQNGYGPPPPTDLPGTAERPSIPADSAGVQQIKPLPPHEPQPNMLADLNRVNLSASQKKEGSGWYAVFSPEVQRVLDVELVHHLAHDSVACAVSFSPDGKYLATSCNRQSRIWDVTTGENIITLRDDSLTKKDDVYIRSVCFSPDGKYLATGSEERNVKIWDISAGIITQTFSGHEQDIYSLAFAGNGRYVASGSGDKTVRLWDVLSGELVHIFNIEGGVTAVSVSPDGRYVAAASLDMNVQIWDTTTGIMVERLEGPNGHNNSVYCVAFAPSGRHIVSGSLDDTMKLWELTASRGAYPGVRDEDDSCVRTMKGHKDFVLTACWTPDGNWIISGSKDHGLQFWDPHTGTAHMLLQGHRNSVLSVTVSSTDTLFATGSGDKSAKIWRYSAYTGNQHSWDALL